MYIIISFLGSRLKTDIVMFLISLTLLHSSVNKKLRGDTGYQISLGPLSARPPLTVGPPKRMPSQGDIPKHPCLTYHLLNADTPNQRPANSLGKESILGVQVTTDLKSCQVSEFRGSTDILAPMNGVSTPNTFLLHEPCSPEELPQAARPRKPTPLGFSEGLFVVSFTYFLNK